MGSHYRPDIDGLRAVAIIPVVLFHLGVTSFGGGFLGVDVFFVISGYLITSIIVREAASGAFSFARFYERRMRRLFPALFVVLFVSLLLAALLLLPDDFRSFSRSLAAASVFVANVHFYQTGGYFAATAEAKPLLHTWSLSVEEQFYIGFPLLLILLQRFMPQRTRLIVATVALISLVGTVAMSPRSDAVFFLPMFRAWELLIGALLALNALPAITSARLCEFLALIGSALIVCAIAFARESGLLIMSLILATTGAALLIHVGTSGTSVVTRLLSRRTLVFVGLISYPLYLWHWPLIVFSRYYAIRPLSPAESVAIAAVSVIAAVLTWRYVERPFRFQHGIWTQRQVFAASSAMVLLFAGCGAAGYVGRGLPGRFAPEVLEITAGSALRTPACFQPRHDRPLIDQACRLGSDAEPTFLFWGDSHALTLASAVDSAARRQRLSGLFLGRSACPPLLGVNRSDRKGNCKIFNDSIAALIEANPQLTRIVLAGRWALNSLGTRYGNEGGPPTPISPDGISGNPRAFRDGFERTMRFLHDGNREVVVVTQAPEVGWDVTSSMARAEYLGRALPRAPTRAEYQARQQIVSSTLADLSTRYRFRVIELADVLCPDVTCRVQQAGRPLYRDSHHLNDRGAALVSTSVERAFREGP